MLGRKRRGVGSIESWWKQGSDLMKRSDWKREIGREKCLMRL